MAHKIYLPDPHIMHFSSVVLSAIALMLCSLSNAFVALPRSSSARSSFLAMMEKTYIMIKPDGVQRGVVGNIISRFEEKGYKLSALKLTTPSKDLLAEV